MPKTQTKRKFIYLKKMKEQNLLQVEIGYPPMTYNPYCPIERRMLL